MPVETAERTLTNFALTGSTTNWFHQRFIPTHEYRSASNGDWVPINMEHLLVIAG